MVKAVQGSSYLTFMQTVVESVSSLSLPHTVYCSSMLLISLGFALSLLQALHSDSAQTALLSEEVQSEASLYLEGALDRYILGLPSSFNTNLSSSLHDFCTSNLK